MLRAAWRQAAHLRSCARACSGAGSGHPEAWDPFRREQAGESAPLARQPETSSQASAAALDMVRAWRAKRAAVCYMVTLWGSTEGLGHCRDADWLRICESISVGRRGGAAGGGTAAERVQRTAGAREGACNPVRRPILSPGRLGLPSARPAASCNRATPAAPDSGLITARQAHAAWPRVWPVGALARRARASGYSARVAAHVHRERPDCARGNAGSAAGD